MTKWSEETVRVAETELALIKGGAGKPLLIFHDELGYPGWMSWNEALSEKRSLLIPLQPGFGKTPRIDWIRNYRDLAGFYSQVVREMRLEPVDVIGFSAGGYIAAEMAAADPKIFAHMVLTAPMGIKPATGEILDFFALTVRHHLRATVADPSGTPEFAEIYGGEMTPAQFEAFEDARAETARIGWEPFMHNPSLPYLLRGLKTPTLLVWGTRDGVVPRGCIDEYRKVISGAQVAEIDGAGHRPEIENALSFERAVEKFLAA
ncbi:MAG TPA: alpha/beta fold hydrolase [Candidatus Binataceae bacterium]|nr:alpha/beta fold hydrolase [Candidatus Binataceae bacterium]